MFGLLLILALLAVGVAVLLAAGTLVIQGYLYSEPADGIAWRSAAAGAVIGLFFGLWCILEARAPGRFDTLLNFSPRDIKVFPQIWSERTNERGKQEILYRQGRSDRGLVVYLDPDGRPWRRSDNGIMTAIIVEEDGQKKRFAAEMNPDGTFRVAPNQPLRYVEADGQKRVMTENAPGEVVTTRYGLLAGNLLLNLLHLAAWFACFWLLMRFQWPHALGLAVLFWLTFGVVVWPVLQERVRRATAPAAAAPAARPARRESEASSRPHADLEHHAVAPQLRQFLEATE
jgi:hypothetical protein